MMESILESQVKIALNNLIIVAEEHLSQNKSVDFTTADDVCLRDSIKIIKAYRDKAIYETTEPILSLVDAEEYLKKEGFKRLK